MKQLIFLFFIFSIVTATAQQTRLGGFNIVPEKSIFFNLSKSGDHTVLTAGIRAAGLEALLNGTGEYTLIAPLSNPIIHEIPAGRAEQLFNELLPEQQREMYEIIAYHILPGKFTVEKLTEMIKAGGGKAELTTLNRQTLIATLSNENTLMLTDDNGRKGALQQTDVIAANGIIHTSAMALLPKGSLTPRNVKIAYPLAAKVNRAQWMQEAKWGTMTHYLSDWQARAGGFQMSIDKWNEMVDNFDVEGLADQLQKVGAKYHILTIGQNSGYYLAPNPVYDRLTGISPSKCSKRDLVADLSKALRKRGIRFMVYLPAGAPAGDREAIRALEWTNGPYPNVEFQLKWEQIIAWWSSHWGDAIDGWWFDGCYWPNQMYRGPEPNYESFARAARAGNANNALAFCPGVVWRTISVTPHEDYIAGEIDNPELISIRRVFDGLVDGSQLHILTNIAESWGMGAPRFTTEQIIGWSKQVVSEKGAITWDVPVQINGLIKDEFLQQLTALGKGIE